MKVTLIALAACLALATSLSDPRLPDAQPPLATSKPSAQSSAKVEERSTFFTLSRDALNFSSFTHRENKQPKNIRQILLEARARHQASSPKLSTAEKIQQLKQQIPASAEQLRDKVNKLPSKLKASARQTTTALSHSVKTKTRRYAPKTKIPTLIATLKRRIYRIRQSAKALIINLLEQASDRLNQTAQQLKN